MLVSLNLALGRTVWKIMGRTVWKFLGRSAGSGWGPKRRRVRLGRLLNKPKLRASLQSDTSEFAGQVLTTVFGRSSRPEFSSPAGSGLVMALSSSGIGSSSLQEPRVSPLSPASVVLDSLPAPAPQPSSSSVGVLVAQAAPVKPPVPFTSPPLLVPEVVPPVILVAPAIR